MSWVDWPHSRLIPESALRGLNPRIRRGGAVPDRSAKGTDSGRGGSRTLKARRSPGFGPGTVADRLALPEGWGGRTRTCNLLLNRQAPLPFGYTPTRVSEVRVELTFSGFRRRRPLRLVHSLNERPSQRGWIRTSVARHPKSVDEPLSYTLNHRAPSRIRTCTACMEGRRAATLPHGCLDRRRIVKDRPSLWLVRAARGN
jgi:hypothetical protein